MLAAKLKNTIKQINIKLSIHFRLDFAGPCVVFFQKKLI